MVRSLTIPGSILIAGEYAVICPNGLGLALAPNRSLRLEIEPANGFFFRGQAHGRELEGTRLVQTILETAAGWFSTTSNDKRFFGRLTADSSELFGPEGEKLGLGSSAALAVALSAYFSYRVMGIEALTSKAGLGIVRVIALDGHRRYQNGGSGYDVLTSLHGNLGVFTGGDDPKWEKFEMNDQIFFSIIRPGHEVSSKRAVGIFKALQASEPGLINRFISVSNKGVLGLAKAMRGDAPTRWSDFYRACMASRRIGRWIGRKLDLDPERGWLHQRLLELRQEAVIGKASGAGDELAIVFSPRPEYFSREGLDCLTTEGGLRWS